MSEHQEKETKSPVFEGPIERGETFVLPEEPLPGEEYTSDLFKLESDVFFNEHLNNIILPKFIMKPTNGVEEKSTLVLTYKANHNPSVFKMILLASKNGVKKFAIHFKDSDSEFVEEEDNLVVDDDNDLDEDVDEMDSVEEYNESDSKVSVWTFTNVRVHGVDFGYVATRRTEPANVSVELSFDSVSIDGIDF
jgi:hypothetical protein